MGVGERGREKRRRGKRRKGEAAEREKGPLDGASAAACAPLPAFCDTVLGTVAHHGTDVRLRARGGLLYAQARALGLEGGGRARGTIMMSQL